jgi:hypothetical protein
MLQTLDKAMLVQYFNQTGSLIGASTLEKPRIHHGPVARKLRYHRIGSIVLPRKTSLPCRRWLLSESEFRLSAGTGPFPPNVPLLRPFGGPHSQRGAPHPGSLRYRAPTRGESPPLMGVGLTRLRAHGSPIVVPGRPGLEVMGEEGADPGRGPASVLARGRVGSVQPVRDRSPPPVRYLPGASDSAPDVRLHRLKCG